MRFFEIINESAEDIQSFSEELDKKYPEATVRIYLDGNDIHLSHISVDKSSRKTGIGTQIMNDIINFADSQHRRITLTPALKDKHWGTTSRARLIKFYKRFGFVQNSGRNKDFTISAADMYRDPK